MGDFVKLRGRPKIKKVIPLEDGRLKLSWKAVEGAEKYAVLRKDSPDGEFEHIKWRKKQSFIDEVQKDKTYWYKIVASKTLEGKKKSTRESAVKSAIVSDIEPPVNLSVETVDGAIVVTWDKVSKASGYIVNRKNAFSSQMLPVSEPKKCRFVDKNVVSGQVYHYSVQSLIKNDGEIKQGNFSDVALGVCLDSGEILSYKVSGKKVNLSLRIVAGADGYIVERSDDNGETFNEVAKTEGITDIYVCDKTPAHFKSYIYRVKAFKILKTGEYVSVHSKSVSIKSK